MVFCIFVSYSKVTSMEDSEDQEQDPKASDSTGPFSSAYVDRQSSEADQTASASDQTRSDADQTAADDDQTSSDSDQGASDEEQAASDEESTVGAGQRTRDMGNEHRERATQLRGERSRARLRTAVARDISADQRDQVASTRDQTADMRELSAPAPEHLIDSPGLVGRQQAFRAAQDRKRASDDRTRAAADRSRAAKERAQSAHDRTLAARDRAQAVLDRQASETDELTRVRRRGPGMAQLRREIDRARRAHEALVVTFVDVDGLKRVNDNEGHLAGDSLLLAVADSLRKCLRLYDLIMRFGGDEFVCVLSNADVKGVRQRFDEVSRALAATVARASITVGFAELHDNDVAEDLIYRADADLLARRGGRDPRDSTGPS
jgi:diguanylate cyclase (GGDEF)-like protein